MCLFSLFYHVILSERNNIDFNLSKVALAITGGYFGLFALFKVKSAISKKAPTEEIAATPAAAPSSDGNAMPSLDSRKSSFLAIN